MSPPCTTTTLHACTVCVHVCSCTCEVHVYVRACVKCMCMCVHVCSCTCEVHVYVRAYMCTNTQDIVCSCACGYV